MAKKKDNQLKVRFKDKIFKLPEGHKVFQLNLNTSPFLVTEAKIVKEFTLWFWAKPVYKIANKAPHLIHTPAKDLYAAKIKFKQMTRGLKDDFGRQINIKGL